MKQNQGLRRTGYILNKKYMLYMIPAMLSAVGIALSEFADSMVVSMLLGSNAFAIINLGTPVIFMVSMVYTVIGLGGSLLFAECLGRKDKENSDNYYSISTVMALVIGIILLVLMMKFHPILGGLFGCPTELQPEFNRYISVLRFFIPFGILLMHLSYYLPVVGKPFLSVWIVVSVNILNIILDFVFIRGFEMGCEGAAVATLVSYILVFVITFMILRFCHVPLTLRRFIDTRQCITKILKKGFPAGCVQAGYAVTTIFCNHFMNLSFGINGVVTMSLFGQLDSVISIALTGIVDNNASFAAMLKSEGDYYGIRILCKLVTIMIVLSCLVLSVLFAVFPEALASVFSIYDPDTLILIRKLICIYVLYYPLRSILLVLRDIYNTLDRTLYATALGVLDKVVSIPLIGGILYILFGGYGLIAAFPVSMVLILCLIAGINHRVVKRSNRRYSPILLLDEEYPMKAICSYSVTSPEDAAGIGRYIGKTLEDKNPGNRCTDKLCLAAEEISLYILNQCGIDTAVDYLLSFDGKNYILTCRNPGTPFYPISEDAGDLSLNELILTGFFRIRHEYVFGLNSTSLTIGALNE